MTEPQDQTSQASSSRQKAANSGKDPPALNPTQTDILKKTQESLIRMLAEKKIDTNVFSPPEEVAPRSLKPNEQNIKNRAREEKFNAHIQK